MPSRLETIPTLHVNQRLLGENPAEVFAELGREVPMVLLDANDFIESASLLDPRFQDTFKSLDKDRWRDPELVRSLRPEEVSRIVQIAAIALEFLTGEQMVALQRQGAIHEKHIFAPVTDPEQLHLSAYRNVDISNLDIRVASGQPGLAHTVYGATILLGGTGMVRAAVADVIKSSDGNLFRAPKVMTHEVEAVDPVTILGYIAQTPREDLNELIRPTAYGIIPIPTFKNTVVTTATVFGLVSEWQRPIPALPVAR